MARLACPSHASLRLAGAIGALLACALPLLAPPAPGQAAEGAQEGRPSLAAGALAEAAAAARALRPPGAPGEKAVLDALHDRVRRVVSAVEHPATRAAW